MENKYINPNVSMFVVSLKALRENMTYVEFDQMLRDIQDANDRGKLDEFLDQAAYMFNQGTDLPTSFHYAMFDIVQEQGENF